MTLRNRFLAWRYQAPVLAVLLLVGGGGGTGVLRSQQLPLPSMLLPAMAQPLTANQAYQQGLQQFNQRAYTEAITSFEAAVDLAIAANDRGLAALALYQLGRTYDELGRYTQAMSDYQTALELWDALALELADTASIADIQFNRAVVLNGLGRSLRTLGNYAQARTRYDEALAIHRQQNNRREQAIILDEIAKLLSLQGQYEAALRIHDQALTIITGNDPLGENRILNNIGVTYQTLGRLQRALALYREALAINGLDSASQLITLINLASVYVRLQNLEAAEQYFQQVLALQKQDPTLVANPFREAKLASDIGSFYAAQQRYSDAIDAYERALSLYAQLGNATGEATLYNNIGNVFVNVGDYEQAEAAYLNALEISTDGNDLPGKGKVLTDLGELYDILGEPAQARQYYQQAVDDVFESVLANIQSSSLKASFASRHAAVYRRLIELLWDNGDYELAFNYAERSRARAFLDQIANGTINFRTGVEASLLEREQRLREDLIQLQDELDRLELVAETPDETASQRAQLAEKQDDYLILVEQLKRLNPEAADLTAVNPASLETIQELLDADTTLVEYFLLEERVLAFVVTQSSLNAVELPLTPAAIDEAVQSFYEYDLATLHSPYPRSLQQLYGGLIAPLQSYLTTERLAIAAHSKLHYVPFAALTDGQQFLVDNYQLTQLPSANVLRFLDAPPQQSGKPVVLGNPTFDLPFAAEEARAIAALYNVQPLIGQEATERQLRAQANQAKILHLATHGEYNASNPLFSQILFADSSGNDDGRLQVHEIYELDLSTHTQLVVLSACQTQVGEASDGDEIIGLNRAFLYAGTPNVIATLWPISDETTADLMRVFYGFLQEGLSSAEALQRAQQAIKQDHPHPYYWAAFGLTGNGQ